MNPIFFAYSSLTGVVDAAKPGAIIVTGRGNRYAPEFQEARKRGAHVWVYWNVLNCPDDLKNPNDAEQFLINGQRPPLWPYPTPGTRSNWPGTKLLDIRPGSAWMKSIIAKTGVLIEKHLFDGLMLDTMGAQPWAAEYATWPVEEQKEWTGCCVNMSREIYEECLKHDHMMEINHNNLWVMNKTHPAYAIALNGEKYCNGVMLENPPPRDGPQPSAYHKAVAARPYGVQPRRLPVIHTTDPFAITWSQQEGVTHVSSVEKAKGETYAQVTPPVVAYDGWTPDEGEAENAALRARVAELTAENAQLTQQLEAERQRRVAAEREVSELNTRMADIHARSAPTVTVELDEAAQIQSYRKFHQEPS
jgi:hypothetical protein